MSKKEIIKIVEKYAVETMSVIKDGAHNFEHVDRTRKWAIKIGKEEKADLFILEIAALLHDIGRKEESESENHFVAGERMARQYLKTLNFFNDNDINIICRAILEHGPGGKGKISKILQDADRMDLWGAVILQRAILLHREKPLYIDKNSFKFKKLSAEEIHTICQRQMNTVDCILAALNVCLNIYNEINTKTAKKLAKQKVAFLKSYIKQLKKETIDI